MSRLSKPISKITSRLLIGAMFLAIGHTSWLGNVARAQDAGLLNIDMAATRPASRFNAPRQLLFDAYWNGSTILEGHFRVRYFADGATIISETKSHDIVLAPGRQQIRIIIPRDETHVGFTIDEVNLEFVADNGKRFDLKRYPLPDTKNDRSANICVIGPDGSPPSREESILLHDFDLGRLIKTVEGNAKLNTRLTRWDRADVPEQAMQFCAFDMVFFRPEGFANIRQNQLDAILQWVRAGGSVCCLLSKELESKHAQFLNDLMAESHETPFLMNTSGEFSFDETSAPDGVWTSPVELGRAAIINMEARPADDTELWEANTKISSYVWRIRKSLRDWIPLADSNPNKASRMRAQFVENRKQARRADNPRYYDEENAYVSADPVSWVPDNSFGTFVRKLMPDDVRIVPMGLIGFLLMGYLLVIGPGDYFILGWLRKRTLTWITFPLATVLVSLLCMGASNFFLSSTSKGKTLTIRDMAADGSVLRESRFQMLFTSRQTNWETEVEGEFFAAMDAGQLAMDSYYNFPTASPTNNGSFDTPVRYEGRMPESFKVTQRISQWSPQVNRFFSIAPERDVPKFAWNDASLMKDLARLRIQAEQSFPNASVTVLRGEDEQQVSGDELFQFKEIYDRYGRSMYGVWNGRTDFMHCLCKRNNRGLFSFISQMSPTGGGNFEDLTLLDQDDPSQSLLIISEETDNELIIYRRLFTGSRIAGSNN